MHKLERQETVGIMTKNQKKVKNNRIFHKKFKNEPKKNQGEPGENAQKPGRKTGVSAAEFVDNAMPYGEIDKFFDVFYEK